MDFQAIQPVAPVNENVNAPYRAGQTYQEIISRPEVQEQIKQGSQTMADIARGPINLFGDVMARTLGIIAENMVNEEAAERGRQRFQNEKEAAKMFGVLYQQLSPEQKKFYEQRTGKSLQTPSLAEDFSEGFNYTLDFILREAIDGSNAIRAGKKFTELPGSQQLGVGILPLEFWLGGFGARKVVQETGCELLQKYKDMQLSELVANPQAQKEIPEVIEAVKREYPVLEKFTGPRLTTERPSDMDLTLSQMEAADQRGMRFMTGKPRTKLIDRPDDIKKIQEIIAAEKKKTGKEFTIKEAAALLQKKAPELPTSNQSLSKLLKEGVDLGITNVFRPTLAERDLVTTNANKLADIIKQNLPENAGLSSKELVKKYGFDNLLQRNRGAQTGLKTRAKSILNAIPGYKESQFAIRSATAGKKRRAATDPQLIKILNDFIDQDLTHRS